MMIYKTTGTEPVMNVFLAELRMKVLIAGRAYDTLHNQHLYVLGNRDVETCSPIKVVTDYALFLNSAAMINKILGLSERYDNDRAGNLRVMMDLDKKKLCGLKSVDLRKFNPQKFTMQCIGKELVMHTLDVKKCYEEIQYIELAIEVGAKKLSASKAA